MTSDQREQIQKLIDSLKEVSARISVQKVRKYNDNPDKHNSLDELFKELDKQQDKETRKILGNLKIKDPEEFFYSNGYVFFKGWDATPIGALSQMFLYEIAEKKDVSVKYFGIPYQFECVKAGTKHFHGIFDVARLDKVEAQTIGKKFISYLDPEETFRDITSFINEVTSSPH